MLQKTSFSTKIFVNEFVVKWGQRQEKNKYNNNEIPQLNLCKIYTTIIIYVG